MNETLNSPSSLSGKTVAITGSTGGLGTEFCYYLAELGASLIMIDRNEKKAEALERKLKADFPRLNITRIKLDLEEIESVKPAVQSLSELSPDIFIHNAGAYSIPLKKCTTGYNNVFQINFVSPYYIIRELYEKKPDIKIVAVGSIAHNYSKINTNDIDFSSYKAASKLYGNAKRYLMFSLYELFKENEAGLSIVHPGITFTNITAHYPKPIFAIIKHPMKIIFMKPKKAALSILSGVFNFTEKGFWIGPRFFNVWGKPKKQALKTASAKEIFEISKIAEEIYKNTKAQ